MARKIRGRNEGSISQRPNGKWRAQISLGGKRISFSAKTKADCQDWLRKKQSQIDLGLTYDSTKTTLAEYMADWLSSAKASFRYVTWTQYQWVTDKYILPGIGKLKLVDLKPDQIQRLYDRLLQEGTGRYTILKIHTVLGSALSRATKTGIIARNPTIVVMLPKEPENEMQILDASQVNRLLFAARVNRFEALYHLAVTTGMRQMELLGLMWSDLDWARKTLKVERQLARSHGQGIEFISPKTKFGKRSIQLGAKTIEALRKHDQIQQQDRIIAGDQWQENGLIFTNHFGGPMNCRNLLRDYKRLLREVGLPSIRFHDLRHTAASLMLNSNVPVIVVSRRLGHSRPSITLDIYGHLIASAQTEVADLIDEMITPIELHQTAPDLHQEAIPTLVDQG